MLGGNTSIGGTTGGSFGCTVNKKKKKRSIQRIMVLSGGRRGAAGEAGRISELHLQLVHLHTYETPFPIPIHVTVLVERCLQAPPSG